MSQAAQPPCLPKLGKNLIQLHLLLIFSIFRFYKTHDYCFVRKYGTVVISDIMNICFTKSNIPRVLFLYVFADIVISALIPNHSVIL